MKYLLIVWLSSKKRINNASKLCIPIVLLLTYVHVYHTFRARDIKSFLLKQMYKNYEISTAFLKSHLWLSDQASPAVVAEISAWDESADSDPQVFVLCHRRLQNQIACEQTTRDMNKYCINYQEKVYPTCHYNSCSGRGPYMYDTFVGSETYCFSGGDATQ